MRQEEFARRIKEIRVIETIRLDEKPLKGAALVCFGRALYVIPDLRLGTSPSIEPGAAVRVHRPDGPCFEAVLNGVEVWVRMLDCSSEAQMKFRYYQKSSSWRPNEGAGGNRRMPSLLPARRARPAGPHRERSTY